MAHTDHQHNEISSPPLVITQLTGRGLLGGLTDRQGSMVSLILYQQFYHIDLKELQLIQTIFFSLKQTEFIVAKVTLEILSLLSFSLL